MKIDDLCTVQNKTWSARWKWYHTGIGLGISVDTLEAIKLNSPGNCDRCYTAVLTEWLRRAHPRPTWSALGEALRSPSVNMRQLAEQLPNQGEFIIHHEALRLAITPMILFFAAQKHSRKTKRQTQTCVFI